MPCTKLRHLAHYGTEYSSVMWHYINTPGVEVQPGSDCNSLLGGGGGGGLL